MCDNWFECYYWRCRVKFSGRKHKLWVRKAVEYMFHSHHTCRVYLHMCQVMCEMLIYEILFLFFLFYTLSTLFLWLDHRFVSEFNTFFLHALAYVFFSSSLLNCCRLYFLLMFKLYLLSLSFFTCIYIDMYLVFDFFLCFLFMFFCIYISYVLGAVYIRAPYCLVYILFVMLFKMILQV